LKTEILKSEEITKDMAINELSTYVLNQSEINEYLDIISAINKGEKVFNLTTNKGEYLLYIKNDAITDTKTKSKK
jgi:hypothetical protein